MFGKLARIGRCTAGFPSSIPVIHHQSRRNIFYGDTTGENSYEGEFKAGNFHFFFRFDCKPFFNLKDSDSIPNSLIPILIFNQSNDPIKIFNVFAIKMAENVMKRTEVGVRHVKPGLLYNEQVSYEIGFAKVAVRSCNKLTAVGGGMTGAGAGAMIGAGLSYLFKDEQNITRNALIGGGIGLVVGMYAFNGMEFNRKNYIDADGTRMLDYYNLGRDFHSDPVEAIGSRMIAGAMGSTGGGRGLGGLGGLGLLV